MRVMIFQLNGDYREAYHRLKEGGEEYYYGQRRSVSAVANLAPDVEEIAVLCGNTAERYDEILAPGLRAIGAGLNGRSSLVALVRLINAYNPTHLVINDVHPLILAWPLIRRRPAMVMMANSFPESGLRSRLRNQLSIAMLNSKVFKWFGAYGLTAAQDYNRQGIHREKIIPWDFIKKEPPVFEPKTLRSTQPPWQLFYVGSLIEEKGVGNILDAIARLKSKNISVQLKIAGLDHENMWARRAEELGIKSEVDFLGLVPNASLGTRMREADAVLVPSWHSYPEGFPLVIVQALESCSPIIASDHPMFCNHLKDEQTAVLFPAGRVDALANAITRLLTNPVMYQTISANSEHNWQSLNLPVKHQDLLEKWIRNTQKDRAWLSQHCLSSSANAH